MFVVLVSLNEIHNNKMQIIKRSWNDLIMKKKKNKTLAEKEMINLMI